MSQVTHPPLSDQAVIPPMENLKQLSQLPQPGGVHSSDASSSPSLQNHGQMSSSQQQLKCKITIITN